MRGSMLKTSVSCIACILAIIPACFAQSVTFSAPAPLDDSRSPQSLELSPSELFISPAAAIVEPIFSLPESPPTACTACGCSPCATFVKIEPTDRKLLKNVLARDSRARLLRIKQDRRTSAKLMAGDENPLDELRNILFAIANSMQTCYFGAVTSEARAFEDYRKQATNNWNDLLKLYLDGKYTNAQWQQKMFEWFLAYRQRFANCGERAKFSSVAAALRGYLTYDCRATADHEFAVVRINGLWYILDAMPTTDKNKVIIGPVTLTKNGRPTQDPSGADITLNGQALPKHPGPLECNLIFDPGIR